MSASVKINVNSPQSRFVAVDSRDTKRVIAEGRTAASVAKKAQKTGCAFTMAFVPKSDKTYIF